MESTEEKKRESEVISATYENTVLLVPRNAKVNQPFHTKSGVKQ